MLISQGVPPLGGVKQGWGEKRATSLHTEMVYLLARGHPSKY